jgi:hypothetical protein
MQLSHHKLPILQLLNLKILMMLCELTFNVRPTDLCTVGQYTRPTKEEEFPPEGQSWVFYMQVRSLNPEYHPLVIIDVSRPWTCSHC